MTKLSTISDRAEVLETIEAWLPRSEIPIRIFVSLDEMSAAGRSRTHCVDVVVRAVHTATTIELRGTPGTHFSVKYWAGLIVTLLAALMAHGALGAGDEVRVIAYALVAAAACAFVLRIESERKRIRQAQYEFWKFLDQKLGVTLDEPIVAVERDAHLVTALQAAAIVGLYVGATSLLGWAATVALAPLAFLSIVFPNLPVQLSPTADKWRTLALSIESRRLAVFFAPIAVVIVLFNFDGFIGTQAGCSEYAGKLLMPFPVAQMKACPVAQSRDAAEANRQLLLSIGADDPSQKIVHRLAAILAVGTILVLVVMWYRTCLISVREDVGAWRLGSGSLRGRAPFGTRSESIGVLSRVSIVVGCLAAAALVLMNAVIAAEVVSYVAFGTGVFGPTGPRIASWVTVLADVALPGYGGILSILVFGLLMVPLSVHLVVEVAFLVWEVQADRLSTAGGAAENSTLGLSTRLLKFVGTDVGKAPALVVREGPPALWTRSQLLYGRPQVVVTTGAIATLTGDELEAVLAHEAAHVRLDVPGLRATKLLSLGGFVPRPLLSLLIDYAWREERADRFALERVCAHSLRSALAKLATAQLSADSIQDEAPLAGWFSGMSDWQILFRFLLMYELPGAAHPQLAARLRRLGASEVRA